MVRFLAKCHDCAKLRVLFLRKTFIAVRWSSYQVRWKHEHMWTRKVYLFCDHAVIDIRSACNSKSLRRIWPYSIPEVHRQSSWSLLRKWFRQNASSFITTERIWIIIYIWRLHACIILHRYFDGWLRETVKHALWRGRESCCPPPPVFMRGTYMLWVEGCVALAIDVIGKIKWSRAGRMPCETAMHNLTMRKLSFQGTYSSKLFTTHPNH